MKKLMVAMAITSMIGIAQADLTSTGFEDDPPYTAGESLDTSKDDAGLTEIDPGFAATWRKIEDDDGDNKIFKFDAEGAEATPSKFSDKVNSQYLHVETGSNRVERFVQKGGDAISIPDAIYLDTLVKFTASEDLFKDGDLEENVDKIAISYVGQTEGENPISNIVVRAGYVDGSTIVPTNYIMNSETEINPDNWYRLTVRTIANTGSSVAPVGFAIYLDGKLLVYDVGQKAGKDAYETAIAGNSTIATYLYNSQTHAFLPSLVNGEYNTATTLSAVGFKGTGCIDNIAFLDSKPAGLPDEGISVTIAWEEGVDSYTVEYDQTSFTVDVSGSGLTNITFGTGITAITVTAEYDEGYERGSWTASNEGLAGDVWTIANNATLTMRAMLPKFAVGENNYGTFADALVAAVAAGTEVSPATIKLLANISEGISFASGYIVLDLNGKTLQGTVEEFTINNSGASLTIIDSASGGTVIAPDGDASRGALYMDDGSTVIDGGLFEGYVITQKMDDGDGADDLTVNGGVFYDDIYDPTDVDSKFYLYDYLGDGLEATYDAGYFTVGSPIIGTYTVTVTPNANATYAAVYNDGGAAVEFVNDVAAVTVGQTITITATPASGYEYAETPSGWTAGQDGAITIEVSAAAEVEIPEPTAVSSSELDPASNTPVEIEAESAAAATNAVQLVTPSGVEPAAYKDLFDFTVTEVIPGAKYDVAIAGIKESVEETVEESALAVLAEEEDAKVAVPAGLYYKITTYTTLGGAAVTTQSDISDGTGVSVSRPGTTQGFIQIEMATTPFN